LGTALASGDGMIPGRQYTLSEWPGFVWKRKGLVFVTFLLVTTLTIVVAFRRPDRYRAEALILAESRSVAPEYVRASVTTETVADRLPTISQQILSHTRLVEIILELNLYAGPRRAAAMDAVVARMRNDIQVKVVQGSESFRVSYVAEDPDLAVKVTERLVGPFIEENSRDRAALARQASLFLEGQLSEARARLVGQEKRLEAYRRQHGTELPTQFQSNLQVIQNTQTQVQAINDAINRDRDRRLLAARLLADLQSEQFVPESKSATTRASSEEIANPEKTTAAQLDNAVADLRVLEGRLTAQHPDLMRARGLVADLQKEVKEEAAVAAELRRPLTAAETAKRNRITELQTEIESLDRQIANRLATEEQLRAEIHTYQSRVEALPTRESELASLTRDYDTLQNVYRTLLAKREDSKISENLEQQKVGSQYRIVDPPHRPQTPLGPRRRVIALGGTVAGLVLGVALALLLQLLDKSLAVAADVHAALDLRVVATIPLMPSDAEQRRAARRRIALSVALAALLVICATTVWLSARA
jgi:protein tyrosine kinase modulator